MIKKTLEENELQKIHDLRNKFNDIVYEIGLNEIQLQEIQQNKEFLNKNLQNIKKEEISLMEEIQKKYGKCNISLETGEILPI